MNRIERRLMEEGLLEEKDMHRKAFDFSWIYIHFANSIAKSIILLFILLAIGLASVISGSVDVTMGIVVLSAVGAVIKFKNAFLANIYAISALFAVPMYYTENILLSVFISYIFYMATLIYYKNSEAFSIFLPMTYSCISLIFLEHSDFGYKNIVAIIALINFGLICICFYFQDFIRKSVFGGSYRLILTELILTSFAFSIYYEFEFVSQFFGREASLFLVYFQNIVYALANIYLLFKMNYLSVKYRVFNGLILILSIKVPFIAFSLFIYNLADYNGYGELKKFSYVFLLLSTFLLYHSFTITFIQKSIVVGIVGICMLIAYFYLKAGEREND